MIDERKKKLKNIRKLLIMILLGMGLIGNFNFHGQVASAMNNSKKVEKRITPVTPNFDVADLADYVLPAVVTLEPRTIENTYRGLDFVSGLGSGFFISPKLILTTFNVVSGSHDIKVLLNDGIEVEAKIVNEDQKNNLALLEVITPGFENSRFLKLGSNEESRAGEWVLSAGTPFDPAFAGSVSVGTISSYQKINIEGREAEFIVSDISFNTGNGGGPLVNFKGEVVGINSGKILAKGYEKMAIAIPVNVAKTKLEDLKKKKIDFGIVGKSVNTDLVNKDNNISGVFVMNFKTGSLALKAGIKPGDIITEINGVKIDTVDKMNKVKENIDKKINIKIIRNGKNIELKTSL